eukprot:m.165624 g.165624  ORF g.165624 m.165624 type:complete len:402 (+) comp14681_c0_seq2:267-1472(+)
MPRPRSRPDQQGGWEQQRCDQFRPSTSVNTRVVPRPSDPGYQAYSPFLSNDPFFGKKGVKWTAGFPPSKKNDRRRGAHPDYNDSGWCDSFAAAKWQHLRVSSSNGLHNLSAAPPPPQAVAPTRVPKRTVAPWGSTARAAQGDLSVQWPSLADTTHWSNDPHPRRAAHSRDNVPQFDDVFPVAQVNPPEVVDHCDAAIKSTEKPGKTVSQVGLDDVFPIDRQSTVVDFRPDRDQPIEPEPDTNVVTEQSRPADDVAGTGTRAVNHLTPTPPRLVPQPHFDRRPLTFVVRESGAERFAATTNTVPQREEASETRISRGLTGPATLSSVQLSTWLKQMRRANDTYPSRSSDEPPGCVICFLDWDGNTVQPAYDTFATCGHGVNLCKNCAKQVETCPFCRGPKWG